MKILITGSSGHLGEALMRSFPALGHEVRGVDILPSPFTDKVGSLDQRDFVEECMDGIDAVFHTATLHKPHVVTHSKQDFINTNITATLHLLEAAKAEGVKAFIYSSTTSTFGDAMKARPGGPAVWVNEQLIPIPKNIYGVSKNAAENLCQLFHRNHQLPCLVLKISRFFLDEDDSVEQRKIFTDANLKANEYLHRRVDLADVVSAHVQALAKAPQLGFGRYIISATTPFSVADLPALGKDAHQVVASKFPEFEEVYAKQNWKMYPSLSRVYVNELARQELDWRPQYDFQRILQCLQRGEEYRSEIARQVGFKGYHSQSFEGGHYPV